MWGVAFDFHCPNYDSLWSLLSSVLCSLYSVPMKKGHILHPALARVIAELGHGDLLVIADAGLPIPQGVERIDLAFAAGQPAFADVLVAVLNEMEVERAILAGEFKTVTAAAMPRFVSGIVETLESQPKIAAKGLEYLSQDEFKQLTHRARAVVRTGEFTPYANVILVAGVVF
jgi:D-ribose pyranase